MLWNNRYLYLFSLVVAALLHATGVRATENGQVKEALASIEPETEDLEVVVVTATRTERPISKSPLSTEVVDAEAIASSGARTVAELLQRMTNLYLAPTFAGIGLEIQGLTSEYSLILVDGQKLPGRVGGVIDLSRLPLENVERIEIIRGASSALYGADALAGVVNIITKESEESHFIKGSFGYGLNKSIDASAQIGGRNGDLTSQLALGVRTSPGFDLSPDDISTTGNAYEQINISHRSHLEVSKDFELEQRADYLYRDQRGVELRASGAVFDRSSRTETFSLHVAPKLNLSANSNISMSTSYSMFRDQYLLDQRNSANLDSYQETWEHLFQLGIQWNSQQWDSHRLSIGVDASYESLESQRIRSGSGNRTRSALFVQDEWELPFLTELSCVPGLRVDHDSQFGTKSTPKLGIRYAPWKDLVIRASYGWGYRAPTFKELLLDFQNPSAGYAVNGNDRLKPETSQSVNFGVELTLAKRWKLGTNLFRNELQNMIVTELVEEGSAGGAKKYSYVNVGEAYTEGVDSFVDVSFGSTAKLKLGHGYTIARDRVLQRRLEGRAKHRFNIGLQGKVKWTNTRFFLNATRVGERRFFVDGNVDGVAEKVDAPPFTQIDVNFRQPFLAEYSLYLKALNLLNEGGVEYLPIEPRTVVGGIEGTI